MALCLTQIYYWRYYSHSSITLTILYLGVQIFTKYSDSFLNIFSSMFYILFWTHNVLNVNISDALWDATLVLSKWAFKDNLPRNINILPRWLGLWKKIRVPLCTSWKLKYKFPGWLVNIKVWICFSLHWWCYSAWHLPDRFKLQLMHFFCSKFWLLIQFLVYFLITWNSHCPKCN